MPCSHLRVLRVRPKGLTLVMDHSCRSRDLNPHPRVTSPFLHLKTLDILLLIVNISVAYDASDK